MRLHQLNKAVLSVKNNAAKFLNGITSNTLDQPRNAFLDLHGKIVAVFDQVKSGDRIRVEITLEAKNNYEYLVAEDYKPAGCEAVELKSGAGTADVLDHKGLESGEKTWLYQEFRDQKAAFFLTQLKQGKHKIVYELRAEVPGEFHGMPNQVHAMYVPEIRANSAEMRLKIADQE